jgi:N-acetylglucosaminyldiphosphoundecaprenol N-acetyl-beta-D-mannosaminyltransferase
MGRLRAFLASELAGEVLRRRHVAALAVALMPRVHVLNGQFDALTLPQTVEATFRLLASGQRGWLCTVNVAILMMMRADQRLQQFADRAAVVVADGKPLIWCARWLGRRLPERVAGVDLIDALCERAACEGRVVYLLGATESVVARVAQRLRERHAGLRVEWADGYFPTEEARRRAERVRASGADLLFVGMGVPRQERFVEEQWELLGAGIAVCVGGSFDVLAGERARAPLWVQRCGMEWLFRLVQEPRRLFLRYLVTNSLFVWLAIDALVHRLTAGWDLPDEAQEPRDQ